MNTIDVTLAVFTACNVLRLVAYLPQLVRINQDTQGAFAISYSSWAIFAFSNLSTAIYGLAVMGDWAVTLLFAANTVCCFAIIGLTAYKRAQYRATLTAKAHLALRPKLQKQPVAAAG